MRIHHLNCGSFCPHGRRLINGEGGLLERASVVCHCLAIETGDGLVLVDTGFGMEDARNPRQLGAGFRLLMDPRPEAATTALRQIEALGFAAGDVKHIVLTHLDLDHAGGLPDFPEAEVHVFAPELEAALHPHLRERLRYIGGAHWKHSPRWVEHGVGGDDWFGFGSVRILPGLDAEVLLVPLVGHSRGHTAIAVKTGEGWLLHCGDGYFNSAELATPPSCPPIMRIFQTVMATGQQGTQEQPGATARAGAGPRRRGQALLRPRSARAGAGPGEGRRRRGRVSGAAPEKLWEPSAELVERSRLREYMRWLEGERGLSFGSYDELWRWSVSDLEAFWASIWDFFGIQADGGYERVLASRTMPGAEWFAGTSLNYAEHVFAGKDEAETAILHASELRELGELSWGELRTQVAAAAGGLRALGIEPGDRVAAYMPNIPEAIVAFLAAASIGATWSSCSPDFGPASVIDRFAQIEPKVLIAVDGYRYGGKDFDRHETLAELQAAMPSLVRTVVLSYLDPAPDLAGLRGAMRWDELLASGKGADLAFERVPFDHPLWVLYSSGTTGLPKAIVQSQGGILLEHLKKLHLHVDAHPGDRLFWFTTTGWMMWNFLVSGLLTRAAIVLYDGSPGHPGMGVLWDLAERAGVTMFGTSASYIAACTKAGVEPAAGRDLSRLKAVGSTGSPLSPEGFDWIYEQLGSGTWLFSTSGGTDLCTAFVGGVVLLPVYRGELQGRALGAAVEAWDEDGNSVIDEVGELVVTEPMPSMPVRFWGDPDGSRYRASYFEHYPGVWRHGDWIEITSRGTAVIYGRSDSTINRSGIRMGTSEIYRAVLGLEEIVDALVVDIPRPGTEGWMPLFVVLREGAQLDDELRREIARRVRAQCSPRHVPDEVFPIAEVPRTLSGKVLEVPVKRILMGTPPEKAASRDSLANPAALDWFVEFAARL